GRQPRGAVPPDARRARAPRWACRAPWAAPAGAARRRRRGHQARLPAGGRRLRLPLAVRATVARREHDDGHLGAGARLLYPRRPRRGRLRPQEGAGQPLPARRRGPEAGRRHARRPHHLRGDGACRAAHVRLLRRGRRRLSALRPRPCRPAGPDPPQPRGRTPAARRARRAAPAARGRARGARLPRPAVAPRGAAAGRGRRLRHGRRLQPPGARRAARHLPGDGQPAARSLPRRAPRRRRPPPGPAARPGRTPRLRGGV
ncbi:MAG: hypothetical protein AVDCRST_MAG49-1937, partial [uncultured Thermomicrobiales bacterium]